MSDKIEVQLEGAEEVNRLLSYLDAHRVAKANEIIINKSLKQIQVKIKSEVGSTFDKPTPYIKNSIWAEYANASLGRVNAEVRVKGASDTVGKRPPVKYVFEHTFPGQRPQKPFERKWESEMIIPRGVFVVPGADAPLDQFGGVSKANLKRYGDGVKRPRGASPYFLIPRVGVYERKDGRLLQLLKFVSSARYSESFPFYKIGTDELDRVFVANAEEVVDRALQWQTGL